MRVTSLKLANLRAIESAEFSFKSGFNLIVGVNGVGKSSALDALRICLSRVLPEITGSRAKPMAFDVGAIKSGAPFLDIALNLDLGAKEFRFSRLQWKERIATDDAANLARLRRQILEAERLRERARNLLRDLEQSQSLSDTDSFTPDKSALRHAAKQLSSPPLGVFFSTNRSVITEARAAKRRAVGGTSAAYADALSPRTWSIREFAEWMRVQEELESETSAATQHIEALQEAASRFLPGYSNLRAGEAEDRTLLIDKEGATLGVEQLSDGERGVLSMVLDLARRLSQANAEVADPLQNGQAIVLIDEIDLHLHPKWQRQIVRNLTAAFPGCQFIATTHSPQVIGEVAHDRIQIIADGKVYSPTHSYGVDSSRVLEEVMDSASRTAEVQKLITKVSEAIGGQKFEKAHRLVEELEKTTRNANDAEVVRLRTLLAFVEGKE